MWPLGGSPLGGSPRIITALPEKTRLGCCRRSNAIDTLKTHRSAVGNNDAVWFGAAAFAYETNPDLVGRMRPFARSYGMLRDDALAGCDAFITNECRRAGDELSHGALRTVAERATMLRVHPHSTIAAEGTPDSAPALARRTASLGPLETYIRLAPPTVAQGRLSGRVRVRICA